MIFRSSFSHKKYPFVKDKNLQRWCYLFKHVRLLAVTIHMVAVTDIESLLTDLNKNSDAALEMAAILICEHQCCFGC
jgi:hypothetical protein